MSEEESSKDAKALGLIFIVSIICIFVFGLAGAGIEQFYGDGPLVQFFYCLSFLLCMEYCLIILLKF